MTWRVDPLEVLLTLAQARALLFRVGEYEDSGDAVRPLLVWAHEWGLDEGDGAATVAAIVNDAFGDVVVEVRT